MKERNDKINFIRLKNFSSAKILPREGKDLERPFSFKNKSLLLPFDPAVVFLGIYLFELKTYVHRNPRTDVYSNFIHNYQNLEATKLSSVSMWINKPWYIQFGIQKEIYQAIKRHEANLNAYF